MAGVREGLSVNYFFVFDLVTERLFSMFGTAYLSESTFYCSFSKI